MLDQNDGAYYTTIGNGTQIPRDSVMIISRNSDKVAFEAYWGVTLDSDVVFLNSGNYLVINGSDYFKLFAPGNVLVDGPTMSTDSGAGESHQRSDFGAADVVGNWSVVDDSLGTPGTVPTITGTPPDHAIISEFSDAVGTGNYIYEFVEIYCAP